MAASAVFHGVLLALLFFVYHYDTVVSGITLHRDMPLIKFAPAGTSKPKLLSVINAPAAAVKKSTAGVASKPKATVAPVVTPSVEEVKKEKPKGTRAALISGKSEKKAAKKDAEKKKKQKEKKDLEKSKSIKKENAPVVKEAVKVPVATQKVENPVATVQETKPVPEPVSTTNVSPNEAQVCNQEVPELGQEVAVALGETIDDPRLVQYYTQLQRSLSDVWKPPHGVDQECACEIMVQIDWNGTIQDVKIHKSSGVLIYDIAARTALQDAKLPLWTRGRTITVTFKQ